MRRVGWLYVTEFVRYLALLTGFGVFLVPGIWLSYRLAYATEAVVLSERTLAAAFRHSFHLARRRFERWLEMLLVSVTIVLGVCLLVALLYMIPGALRSHAAGYVASLLLVLIWPVFQYAWTFFYLRLIEVEEPGIIEAGPTYAAVSTPHDQAGGAGLAPGGSPPEAIGT
jgi:membrane-anchored glycerophosphoryl diester phosphodiesterase (GDPDase)